MIFISTSNINNVALFMVCITTFNFVLCQGTTAQPSTNETIPPLITHEAEKVVFYNGEEPVELPCVASGEPAPSYRWTLNDVAFDPSGTDGRVIMLPGVGTLLFVRPLSRDEGVYQCFAENEAGVSVTVKVVFRMAILEPFPPASVRVLYPLLGHPLTLHCIPPKSAPEAEIFWVTMGEGQETKPINLTNRVSMDLEGNLHITQVLQEDYQDGRLYACLVKNDVLRRIQEGAYHRINPMGETIVRMPPSIQWQSPTQQVALRNETRRIKCIFSGSPPPQVTWSRLDSNITESSGQELVIENVQYEDAGTYECQGINDEATVPIRRSFALSVEAAPYWTHMPESVDVVEGGTAEFSCETEGVPQPVIFWFSNGDPIEQVPADPRRVVEGNKLTFHNVTLDDKQVVQCNATNKYGYVFVNAYLNVGLQ